MKQVPIKVLKEIQHSYSSDDSPLVPFHLGQEGSDGAIYRFRGQETLVKICFLGAGDSRQDRLRFQKRIAFLTFLFERGVPVVEPIPLPDGRLFVSVEDESGWWLAYAMKKVPGKTMHPKVWEPAFVRSWGRALGCLHCAAQDYPVWERTVDPLSGEELIGWESEARHFIQIIDDLEIKEKWHEIIAELRDLPVTRQGFGMTHNDPHLWNMRWDGERAILLDFEVANHHWFASDIATACQHVLTTLSGGMTGPMQHPERLGDFLREFLAGYAQENHLESFWLDHLEVFFAYRRLLLYTVMPGWRQSSPELQRSWKKMIIDRPDIMQEVNFG